MAEHIIDKFEYDSEVYKFQDNVSGYAPLASPALTGTPTAPTATSGDSSTQIATTAFVQDAMSGAGAGTVTSVGVSNATNGGLTISGSPITSSGTISVGHSNVLTSAQTTSAVYPIKIDKNGHISEYGSAVTIPSITLNGGSTTSPSFYAPTSAGTNGYVLKSNGSGAPSWTYGELTDKKLEVAQAASNGTYYPIFGNSSTSASTKNIDTTGFDYYHYDGTTSITGSSRLTLGNNIAQLTAGNKEGYIQLYGTGAYSSTIKVGTLTANRTVTLPNKGGTIALTDDIPDVSGKIDTAGTGLSKSGTTLNHSNSVTAQTTQAVYPIKIDGQGHISAYGSAVTVPTITLNGSSTTSPSFYAPTSAGTNGYYLKSNGSGAPSWNSFPAIPSNWLNGSVAGSVRTSYSAEEDLVYTIGDYAVAEGYDSAAFGDASHAEGRSTIAGGDYSHAEGHGTVANGDYAHTEGYATATEGTASHAEGFATAAYGSYSHAQNYHTNAYSRSQSVVGEYNILDYGNGTVGNYTAKGQYAFIVGNGTADNARSNAFTVNWNGNVVSAGTITDGSGNTLSPGAQIVRWTES